MTIERICKKCRLYNPTDGVCSVNIIHEGTTYELPVLPNDSCFWEREDVPIQWLRAWSNGKDGFIEMSEEDNSADLP